MTASHQGAQPRLAAAMKLSRNRKFLVLMEINELMSVDETQHIHQFPFAKFRRLIARAASRPRNGFQSGTFSTWYQLQQKCFSKT